MALGVPLDSHDFSFSIRGPSNSWASKDSRDPGVIPMKELSPNKANLLDVPGRK